MTDQKDELAKAIDNLRFFLMGQDEETASEIRLVCVAAESYAREKERADSYERSIQQGIWKATAAQFRDEEIANLKRELAEAMGCLNGWLTGWDSGSKDYPISDTRFVLARHANDAKPEGETEG